MVDDWQEYSEFRPKDIPEYNDIEFLKQIDDIESLEWKGYDEPANMEMFEKYNKILYERYGDGIATYNFESWYYDFARDLVCGDLQHAISKLVIPSKSEMSKSEMRNMMTDMRLTLMDDQDLEQVIEKNT